MTKCRIGIFCATLAVLMGVATAQNSKVGSSPTKPGPDPLKTAIKPLTPKSAIAPRSSSSAPPPSASLKSGKTNSELTSLERQSIKAGGAKSGNTGAAKSAQIKPSGTPAGSGSGINSSYQKPHVRQKN
ncbi:MAG: hypothetical protein WCA49_15650 [Candidatus Sulfotelmatobacter sp.]